MQPVNSGSFPPEKRALILSSFGGGAHIACQRALEPLLTQGGFSSLTQYPIQFLRVSSFLPGIEEVYNGLIQRGWIKTASLISSFVNPIFDFFAEKIFNLDRKLEKTFSEIKPDLVVSVAPLVNRSALKAAARLAIPFILVVPDFDASNYFPGREKVEMADFSSFEVHVPSKNTQDQLEKMGIVKEKVRVSGCPLRVQFTSRKEETQRIEKKQGQKVILVMMGGVGSPALVKYVNALIDSGANYRIVAICGKDNKSYAQLKNLQHSSLTVLGEETDIANWMNAADLLITKPGPTTVKEAEILGLPVLIDHTGEPVFWEEAVCQHVTEQKMGALLYDISQLRSTMDKLLIHSTKSRKPYVFDQEFSKSLRELSS